MTELTTEKFMQRIEKCMTNYNLRKHTNLMRTGPNSDYEKHPENYDAPNKYPPQDIESKAEEFKKSIDEILKEE